MSNVNNLSDFNTSFTSKAPARKMSLVLIGGIVLALIGGIGNLIGSAHEPQTDRPSTTSPHNDSRTWENGDAPQGNYFPASSDQAPSDQASSDQAPSTGDVMDNGYAARERTQDQAAQAFSGYIRDTDTVQDTENGQVYTDVPNDQADAAIQSGAATQVPTAELPTSSDSGAASTPDTSATAE